MRRGMVLPRTGLLNQQIGLKLVSRPLTKESGEIRLRRSRYKNQCPWSGAKVTRNGRVLKKPFKHRCCGCGREITVLRGILCDHVDRNA